MELSILPGHTVTQDHWHWRPGWRLGRRMYTMHLTLQEAPAVEDAIRRLQESLAALDVLRPVPVEGLHLTMTGVGFTDEVTAAQIDEVAAQVFAKAEAMSTAPARPRLPGHRCGSRHARCPARSLARRAPRVPA